MKYKLVLLVVALIYMLYSYANEIFWGFYLTIPIYIFVLYLTRKTNNDTVAVNENDINDIDVYCNDDNYSKINNSMLKQSSKIERTTTTTTTTTETIYLK